MEGAGRPGRQGPKLSSLAPLWGRGASEGGRESQLHISTKRVVSCTLERYSGYGGLNNQSTSKINVIMALVGYSEAGKIFITTTRNISLHSCIQFLPRRVASKTLMCIMSGEEAGGV